MKKIPFTHYLDYRDQCKVEAVGWQSVVGAPKMKESLDAYEAGYSHGFMEALKVLQLHTKVELVDYAK